MAVSTIFSPTSSVGGCSASEKVTVMEAKTSSARPRQSKPAPRLALVAGTRTVMAVASMRLPGDFVRRRHDSGRVARDERNAKVAPASAGMEAMSVQRRAEFGAEGFNTPAGDSDRSAPLRVVRVEERHLVGQRSSRPDDDEVGPA